MRGEYHETLDSIKGRLELPPRARRIREVGLGIIGQPGTTSACAENTRANSKNEGGERNYLRVRGEYPRLIVWLARARGTTSACAENTWSKNLLMPLIGNYLRVRGEYIS